MLGAGPNGEKRKKKLSEKGDEIACAALLFESFYVLLLMCLKN